METHDYSSKGLNHLGLVNRLCNELSLIRLIDSSIPKNHKNVKISNGELMLSMSVLLLIKVYDQINVGLSINCSNSLYSIKNMASYN